MVVLDTNMFTAAFLWCLKHECLDPSPKHCLPVHRRSICVKWLASLAKIGLSVQSLWLTFHIGIECLFKPQSLYSLWPCCISSPVIGLVKPLRTDWAICARGARHITWHRTKYLASMLLTYRSTDKATQCLGWRCAILKGVVQQQPRLISIFAAWPSTWSIDRDAAN